MSRFQKAILGFLIVMLVVLCAWAYWEPMSDLLPDADWTDVRVLAGDTDSPEREQKLASPPMEEILAAVSEARVTRGTKNSYLDDSYFQIYLCPGEGYPTVIYVNQNGRIQVAANMDLDHYQYYEDGEELYQALKSVCTSLSPTGITPHS